MTQSEHLLPLLAGLLQECNLPLVLDADALNLLALAPELLPGSRRAPTILTPHPGEAARLLKVTAKEVQADRLAAAELAKRFQSTVLKCATIVADPAGTLAINNSNNGMATAGSGDC